MWQDTRLTYTSPLLYVYISTMNSWNVKLKTHYYISNKKWYSCTPLRKYVEDLHEEINKTLVEEKKERYSTVMEKLNIFKIPSISSLVFRSNTIPVKTTASYFVNINKLICQVMWKLRRHRTTNITLKKNKAGGLTAPNCETSHTATTIKTARHHWKDRRPRRCSGEGIVFNRWDWDN